MPLLNGKKENFISYLSQKLKVTQQPFNIRAKNRPLWCFAIYYCKQSLYPQLPQIIVFVFLTAKGLKLKLFSIFSLSNDKDVITAWYIQNSNCLKVFFLI